MLLMKFSDWQLWHSVKTAWSVCLQVTCKNKWSNEYCFPFICEEGLKSHSQHKKTWLLTSENSLVTQFSLFTCCFFGGIGARIGVSQQKSSKWWVLSGGPSPPSLPGAWLTWDYYILHLTVSSHSPREHPTAPPQHSLMPPIAPYNACPHATFRLPAE